MTVKKICIFVLLLCIGAKAGSIPDESDDAPEGSPLSDEEELNDEIQEDQFEEEALLKEKREVGTAAAVATSLASRAKNLVRSEVGANNCAHRGGCHRGYCWAGCNVLRFIPNEWCYTTRGRSFNHRYVRCRGDSECNKCWRCAGRCGAI